MFNKDQSEISPLQAYVLTQTVLSLSGKNNFSKLIENFQSGFSLDYLEFMQDDENMDTLRLKVGKYLHKNLFISVEKGIFDEINRFGIEASLFKYLKANAQMDTKTNQSFKLQWRYDY